jgi:hypothetical protein
MKNKIFLLSIFCIPLLLISLFVKNPEIYVVLLACTYGIMWAIYEARDTILAKLNEPERTLLLFFENATYWNCKASEKNKNILETVLQKSERQYKNNSHGWFSVEKLDGETEEDFKIILNKYTQLKKEFEFFTY